MPTPVRKVLITSFGDPSKVTLVDDVLPDPPENHVQIKVLYSGFAGSDINMRLGTYPMQKQAPLTPGYTLVGKVHRNGPKSTQFAVGDTVACLTVYDAQSTYCNQPEKYLVRVPDGLDHQHATALVMDWNTAWGMAGDKLKPGQRVFVHGMSGAVGYALFMLCKMQGAEVYGTASERNHDEIRKLGGTPFVYTNKEWITTMKQLGGVHAVYDPLGFESWDESYSILNDDHATLYGYGGNLATLNGQEPRSVVWPTTKLLSRNLEFWNCKSTVFYYISKDQKTFKPNLERLFQMVQQGKIHVSIKRCFDMEDVQTAHRDWTRLTGMGSVVVKVA